MKYGEWKVIGNSYTDGNGRKRVPCECKCGVKKDIIAYSLENGKSNMCTSCSGKRGNPKHNMVGTPFYRRWTALNGRCTHTKSYKERGIKVEWNNFEEFYSDMFDTFDESLEIDRIDNNGNYSKDNCHWITKAHNASNKSNNSKYGIGIYRVKDRYRAVVYSNSKVVYSKTFSNTKDAIIARNNYIEKHNLANKIQEVA